MVKKITPLVLKAYSIKSSPTQKRNLPNKARLNTLAFVYQTLLDRETICTKYVKDKRLAECPKGKGAKGYLDPCEAPTQGCKKGI